jgi:hypothetical protein
MQEEGLFSGCSGGPAGDAQFGRTTSCCIGFSITAEQVAVLYVGRIFFCFFCNKALYEFSWGPFLVVSVVRAATISSKLEIMKHVLVSFLVVPWVSSKTYVQSQWHTVFSLLRGNGSEKIPGIFAAWLPVRHVFLWNRRQKPNILSACRDWRKY